METIRFDEWERKDAYTFFSRISNPFYMVTFRQDVTDLYRFIKARGLSFYYAMIWACTGAVNAVPAFRVTKREEDFVRLDGRDPSFTDLKPGSERFHIVTMEYDKDIEAFCKEALKKSREQQRFIDGEKETDSLIYYSCLPWIDLTALTNERDLSSFKALDDNIPRIAWGKYTEENGKKTLGLSVEVNHRFIDGVHIGQFAKALEHIIQSLT